MAVLAWIWTVFVFIDGKIDRLDDRIDEVATSIDGKIERLDDRIDAIATSQAKIEGLLQGYFSPDKELAVGSDTALPGSSTGELTDDIIAQRK